MNPSNGQTPLDYLNQISPQTQKSSPFKLNLKTVLVGAVVLIIIICIIAGIASAATGGRKTPWQQLSARLATTQAIANDATTKLKSSQLRSLNSDLKLYLTNTQRDLATPLEKNGIVANKLPESITLKEAGTDISTRLEDARLNAKFDSTYAREMSYQLATIMALYQKLYNQTGSESTKSFLTSAYNNLSQTQKSFEDFSTTTE
jgi:hypothetical protein